MYLLTIVLFSGLAGIIGTTLGGLIGIFMGQKSERTVSILLTFASGIMISISLFDLVPEAMEHGSVWLVAFGVLFGVSLISGLNYLLDRRTQNLRKVQTHTNLESLHHQEKILRENFGNKRLLRAGMIMLFALALHNFPEGMAIGAAGSVNINLSITLAVLLAIHNVPEGMAMAVPLVAGGIKRARALAYIFLAGTITIFGGLFGILIGEMGGNTTALSLSFAAGAMLYVTFCEILPQSVLMEQGKTPALFSIFGIIVGFLISSIL